MRCQEYSVMLSAYVDDELASDEVHDIERHLADCSSCSELLSEFRDLKSLVSEEFYGIRVPYDLEVHVLHSLEGIYDTKRVSTLLWALTAALIAFIAFAAGSVLVSFGHMGWTIVRILGKIWTELMYIVPTFGWWTVLAVTVGTGVFVASAAGLRHLLGNPLELRTSSS